MKKYLSNLNGKSLAKRLLLVAISVILMYFGIACYYNAGLGTDPYSVMVDGQHYLWNMSYGMVTNIDNLFFFSLMLIFGRKYINIGTVINMGLGGTLIDLFDWLIGNYIPINTLFSQVVILLCGVVGFAIGLGIYIYADIGIGGTDFVTLEISARANISLQNARIGFDVTTLVIGLVLGLLSGKSIWDLIGIGTLLCAFGTGIIMNQTVNRLQVFNDWLGPLKKEE